MRPASQRRTTSSQQPPTRLTLVSSNTAHLQHRRAGQGKGGVGGHKAHSQGRKQGVRASSSPESSCAVRGTGGVAACGAGPIPTPRIPSPLTHWPSISGSRTKAK
jgi:hypothetical protein